VGGRTVKEVKPGVRVYWPIMTDIVITPVVPQSENLVAQAIMTKDRHQVMASIVIVYNVQDVVRALSQTEGLNETVNNLALGSVLEVVSQHTLQELQDGIATDIEIKLTKTCRRRLKPFGVRVKRAAFTDFTTCKTLNLVGQGHA
jgi:regulator of protease activity HflC (stomatin/prohibitin superfamily)